MTRHPSRPRTATTPSGDTPVPPQSDPGGPTRRRVAAAGAGLLATVLTGGAGPAAARVRARRPDAVPARAGDAGPRMRGLWIASVAHVDWPSRHARTAREQYRELAGWLDLAVRRNLNAVLLQVRPAADTFWPSALEPWSVYLTGRQGRDPGWDPLGTAVEEAHRRGLQLHAWCNPYRVSTGGRLDALVPSHPARRHPDWVVRYGGRLYYDPGVPAARRHVVAAVTDAVARYPVDGLHFDDYFYPYPVRGRRFGDDRSFDAHGADWRDRAAWRRHNVNLLVKEVHDRVRRLRPGACFGIAPFGVWRNRSTDPAGSATHAGVQSYDDLYADTRRWIREGWVDYVAPQLYWTIGRRAADYAVLLDWWARQVDGTGVRLYAGEAVYRACAPGQPRAWQDPAELSRHLTLARRHPEVSGHLYYNATAVRADRGGAFSRLVRDHYRRWVPAS